VEREKSNLAPADLDLVLLLASSSASLDESPKKNWVENSGGLPPYVRKLARGIMKTGKSKSQAIAIAISRIKKWAAGGDDVNADTRAKAAKALAQWEALKGKNKTKQLVKTTNTAGDSRIVVLAADTSYNMDAVRTEWEELNRNARQKYSDAHMPMESPYPWIKEIWSDFIIVSSGDDLFKVPYTVTDGEVKFEGPVKVEVSYKPVIEYDNEDESYGDLDDQEIQLLGLARLDTEHREKLAKKGKALPGGGFPIVTVDDLKNAIQAVGRAKDPAKAKAHIKKMAAKLGRTDLIPENW
jgi:hypothetical protein